MPNIPDVTKSIFDTVRLNVSQTLKLVYIMILLVLLAVIYFLVIIHLDRDKTTETELKEAKSEIKELKQADKDRMIKENKMLEQKSNVLDSLIRINKRKND